MIRAVVKNGTIHPLDPMPPDWSDGRELVVEGAEPNGPPEQIDAWFQDVESAASAGELEDDHRLELAVDEVRRQAK